MLMTLARNGEKGKLKACDEVKKKKQTEKLVGETDVWVSGRSV